MKVLWCEVKLGHFGIRDLDSFGIALARHLGFDFETRSGGGIRDKTHDGFIADQRSASPVQGNEGKHAVFNLVPLAGSGWEVRYVNVKSSEIR